MQTINTPVSASGYSTEPQQPTTSYAAIGGPARRRLDQEASAERVNVEWHVTPAKLDALLAFMRRYALRGQAFLMRLLQDGYEGLCTVWLVPDSLKVEEREGLQSVLSATVIMQPTTSATNTIADEAVVSLYASHGEGTYNELNLLEQLANWSLPRYV